MYKRLLLKLCIASGLMIGCLETLEEVADDNRPPEANAGPDQTVDLVGQEVSVTLDGSKSKDEDGKIVKYIWRPGSVTPLGMDAGMGDGGASNGMRTDGVNNAEADDDSGTSNGEEIDGVNDAGAGDGGSKEKTFDAGIEHITASEIPDPKDVARPEVMLGEGEFIFVLWATDDDGATSVPDTVKIIVK